MELYFDPMYPVDHTDALEASIEQSLVPTPTYYVNPDTFMDRWCRGAGKLEESTETSTEPAIVTPLTIESSPLPPEPEAPVTQGYTSAGPQPPPESDERPWITLRPAEAARPYLIHEGIDPSPEWHEDNAWVTWIGGPVASRGADDSVGGIPSVGA